MPITLTVTSHQRQGMGPGSVKVLTAASASIGRAPGNDWVLPDPQGVVSRNHARIEYQGGEYLLIDTSVNGTFVNDAPEPIGNGRSHRLQSGDQIAIGEYLIRVLTEPTVTASAPPPLFDPPLPAPSPAIGQPAQYPDPGSPVPWDPTPPRPPAQGHDHPWPAPGPAWPAASGPVHQQGNPGYPAQHETVDPLDVMAPLSPGNAQRPPAPPPLHYEVARDAIRVPPGTHWEPVEGETPRTDHTEWRPPGPQALPTPAPGRPPTDPYQPPMQPRPATPPVAPQPPQLPATSGANDLERLLVAAGLQPEMARAAARNPELAEMLGQILQISLAGMIEVLRARTQIKNQFRLSLTQISARQNNPLKLSIDSQNALTSLFVNPSPGFLPPVEAVNEGFQDIKIHQLAMLAGMQAAFDAMIQGLDPEVLQKRFDASGKGGGILVNNKARYWDLFVEMYGDITDDREASFRRLFGDEFGRAYELHMQRQARVPRR